MKYCGMDCKQTGTIKSPTDPIKNAKYIKASQRLDSILRNDVDKM